MRVCGWSWVEGSRRLGRVGGSGAGEGVVNDGGETHDGGVGGARVGGKRVATGRLGEEM